MTVLFFAALVATVSFGAGLLGSLTGLGGGLIVVPLLTIGFGVDIRYAVGASLVSIIATSSGAAAAFVREGFTNVRVAVLLEVATTSGAIAGALVSEFIPPRALTGLFGLTLLFTALRSRQHHDTDQVAAKPDPLATRLRLDSTYPTPAGLTPYSVQNVPAGMGVMFGAGILSALLGIGAGVVKVIAMDQAMRLPFKVSTTTSNFMIGVTAAASAGVYLRRGYIDPIVAFPVMLGVLGGALLGARLLAVAQPRKLRVIFTTVVVVMAIEMLYRAAAGSA